ncbi:protein kinase-like protein [Coleophoma crateriformis]|uniref:non-specific serine/threonine protein kinase n=1 Tax=Coleophoma crateriformis TaxID=565419 RepID=A0A3D8RW75_9HELO|nr:protein kinase-like protein [Coleophoma crateriformis]
MKRNHTKRQETPNEQAALGTLVMNGPPKPPPTMPEMVSLAEYVPAKTRLRRGGSKLLSVLRALTNSASQNSSTADPLVPTPLSPDKSSAIRPPSPGNAVKKTISFTYLKGQLEPTVVHRTPHKSRPSVLSQEKEVIQVIQKESPPSSNGDSSTAKSSKSSADPRPSQSTGKTSLESKLSVKSKPLSQQSSENRRHSPKESTSPEGSLAPIAEVDTPITVRTPEPEPQPTFISAEKAAATKIFFECHYHSLFGTGPTPRSLRRRRLEGELHRDIDCTTEEKDEKRNVWFKKETDHLRETRVMKIRGSNALKGKGSTTSMYEVVKILGKGSFGVVRLVRERPENDASQDPQKRKEIYAMKAIRKSDMLRNSQEGHLRAERDILVSAEGSRWVVPLIASFQDLNHLYLVMEYMPGGDFLGLLIRDNILSEETTKWYIAEMILCIEEAHSLRWIHRDVKPDNFLISASGHLKISDFGLAFDGHWSHDQAYYNHHRYSLLAKLNINIEGDSIDKKDGKTIATVFREVCEAQGGRDRHDFVPSDEPNNDGILNWRNRCGNRTLARSVVGTSQYMAPEVVKGHAYDARCDWWSLAVILYECLYGHTPFLAEEGGRQQTKNNIVRHHETFHFPEKPSVSRCCRNLIRSIIQDKEHRLCSRRYLKDQLQSSCFHKDYAGRCVYPNDAEDIKAHKWFQDVPWDRLHLMRPPFVPNIKAKDDTHYFDEEEPISDFSESVDDAKPDANDITQALRSFSKEIQMLAIGFIEKPYDSARMRKVEREIDSFNVREEQKDYLKQLVKHYGRKEKKRPRDRMLRDREVASRVLELRKKSAFLGYTYRRIRRSRDGGSSVGRSGFSVGSTSGKKNIWHRSRLSIV